MLELYVGVRCNDSVFLPSINIGLFVVSVTLIMLFFTATNVGGGQL